MAQALIDTCKPGITEYELYAEMQHVSISHGGEEDMIWISSGSAPPPHGKRPPASFRVLQAGDVVVTEYHASYKGYLTGAEVSVSLGDPQKEYLDIHRVCAESQKVGIAAMIPGKLLAEAIKGFRNPIIEAGYGTVECGLHGHGLASPEFPSCMYGGRAGGWSEHAYARIPSIRFAENMVFASATDVYNPSWNENTGLMLGYTILITANGPEELTGLPMDFVTV
jgi:Xaa-Pro dipeptidase